MDEQARMQARMRAERKMEELKAQMTPEDRAAADAIEKMPVAQQELALVTLIAVSSTRSTTLDNGQKNDLLCAVFNFYAAARACAILETMVEHAMQNGGTERALKMAISAALLAVYEKREEMSGRIEVLAEMLDGARATRDAR
jgi:hypothetical protein